MSEENNNKTYTAADIEKYHNGSLSPKEMNQLERAALDDPFLAEALEGYGAVKVNRVADLEELNLRLKDRVGQGKVVRMAPPFNIYRYLKIAAVIILIAGGGLLAYQLTLNKPENSMALENKTIQETKSLDTVPTQTPDSANQIKIDAGLGAATWSHDTLRNVTFGSAAASPNTYTFRADSLQAGDVANNYSTIQKQKEGETIKVFDSLSSNVTVKAENVTSNAYAPVTRQAFDDRDKAANNNIVNAETKRQNRAVENAVGVANDAYYKTPAAKMALNNYFNGRVVDAANNAVPFANVTNIKDNVGTYADANGYFTLISPDTSLNLRIKSVAFIPDTVQLTARGFLNQVTLKEDKMPGLVLGAKRKGEKPKPEDNIKIEEPEPADGWFNYGLYIANNLKVPDEIKKREMTGEVKVSFEVDKFGQPVNIVVEKSLCKECDEEAKRLILQGPKWKLKKKKNNRVTVTVPFETN